MLEIKNLYAGYGKENILKNVSLNVNRGKLLSVIGPNGSGKSTLLKAVTGIIKFHSGSLVIDGISLSDMKSRDVSRKISYLAQSRNTPDMTVEQLVLHGRFPYLAYPRRYSAADRAIAHKAMEQMKVSQYRESPLATLSGGMRQNAYIAMALTQSTDYILLDEPTTYLDISNQMGIMHTLSSLVGEGKGIAVVMHDLPLAFTFSDEIAVVKDGEVLAVDTPVNLYKTNVIKDVFGAKLKFNKDEKCYYYEYEKR